MFIQAPQKKEETHKNMMGWCSKPTIMKTHVVVQGNRVYVNLVFLTEGINLQYLIKCDNHNVQ